MDEKNIPKHIAIIPDGNRRWARKHKKSLLEAYDKGIRKIADVAKWAKDVGVKTLSMWGFSVENLKRSEEEKRVIFNLFDEFLEKGIKKYEEEYKYKKESKLVKILFLGRIDKFPEPIYKKMKKVMEITKDNKPYTINFFMFYSGRAEIVDAVNAIIKDKVEHVDEFIFQNYLYAKGQHDPDLLIRTSGEQRLSGFMPWQTVYTELYFCKKLWPEFEKHDFLKAIEDYKKRKRRFGK